MTKSKVNNKNQKGGALSSIGSQLGNMTSKVNSVASSFTAKADEYKRRGQDRFNRYRYNSLSDTGASDASKLISKLSSGPGFLATLVKGGSGFCNIVFKILGVLENGVNKVFAEAFRLEPLILKGSFGLYIWKLILLLIIIIMIIADWASGGHGGFSKEALQVVYSLCKGLNVIIIFIATLIGAAKVTKAIEDKKKNSQGVKYPFPLLLVCYIVSALPILYELLSLVALSSIVLSYYAVKCTGAKPNTWSWVDSISNFLMLVGGMGFALAFLQFRIKKSCGTSSGNSTELQGPSILMLTSISYFIVLLVITGFEEMISNNIVYWLTKDGSNWRTPYQDCVEDDEEKKGFADILNLILSILITIFLTTIIVIGVIPPLGPLTALATLNDRAKLLLQKAADGIFKILI